MDDPVNYATKIFNFSGNSNSSVRSCKQETLKRWQKAFTIIYSRRVLLSLAHDILLSNSRNEITVPLILPTPSYTTPHIVDRSGRHGSFQIDPEALAKMVREKDMDSLRRHGGIQGVAASLETDAERGIDGHTQDINRRHEAFGSNAKPPARGFFYFALKALKDRIILILLVCPALSLGFELKEHGHKEGWYDEGSIFIAVFLAVVVTAICNFCQSRRFLNLSKKSSDISVEVMREGERQHVSIFNIVVGDVIFLKISDQIPGDGLFLSGHSLQVDESSMTGESDPVNINSNENPFLASGSKVVDGYGIMLITSVGMNTRWGEMMSSISRDSNEQTPRQARPNKLTSYIGKVGLAVAFVVLIVLLVRYFTGNAKDEIGNGEFNGKQMKIEQVFNFVVSILVTAVTIMVLAIHEGLPLAVTLSLAYSKKKMMADQAKVGTCETLGFVTTICTDKTGTLTMNQMKVTKFWIGEAPFGDSGSIRPEIKKLLHEGIGLNTLGNVSQSNSSLLPEFSGSPIEKAILTWAVLELGMNMEELKQSYTILHAETFNSEKKRGGVSLRKNGDGWTHVHWKGAAEMILVMCSNFYESKGTIKAIDGETRAKMKQIIEGMAAQSLQCIGFAYKHVIEEDGINHLGEGKVKKLPKDGLTLLGLVGLKDPCRPGVKEAVEDCKGAGVNVKMITGDNVYTATAIATECGILGPDQDVSQVVVEGRQFRNYSKEQRMEMVDKISVMARSSPLDKLLLVQCLKEKGHVVAVVGDGINDAPTLKEVDVEFSVGIQGTGVAKVSSDAIILDGNFATVLRWGRHVYNNIQKFIWFQFSVNAAALVINFITAVSAGEVLLTSILLLWVNLIMYMLGALALATECPIKELMDKMPVGRTELLITDIMWKNLIAQALYQIAVLLTLQFRGRSISGVDESIKNTLIFNMFVLRQVYNKINPRKLEKERIQGNS